MKIPNLKRQLYFIKVLKEQPEQFTVKEIYLLMSMLIMEMKNINCTRHSLDLYLHKVKHTAGKKPLLATVNKFIEKGLISQQPYISNRVGRNLRITLITKTYLLSLEKSLKAIK